MGFFERLREASLIPPTQTVVQYTPEFRRIQQLPRREWSVTADILEFASDQLRTPEGTWRLRPQQLQALEEAANAGGLIAALQVGAGKSLICLLLHEVMAAKRTVLVIQAKLREQFYREYEQDYSKHFRLPRLDEELFVLSYHDLSCPRKNGEKRSILEELAPDLLICDEAHELRNRRAARTRRVARYLKKTRQHWSGRGCRFVALTGTISTRSIEDYAHLAEWALQEGSPLPRPSQFREELLDWARVVDAKRSSARRLDFVEDNEDGEADVDPGALRHLCEIEESPRSGVRRRLIETEGFVSSDRIQIKNALTLKTLKPAVPQRILQIYEAVGAAMAIKDAANNYYEEFKTHLETYRVLREISLGFYSVWDWPDDQPDHVWLQARAAWHSECRSYLLKAARQGCDSPLLLSNKIQRDEINPALDVVQAWHDWDRVRDRPVPPRRTVWVDDFAVQEAVNWGQSRARAIVWCGHRAFARAVGDRAGWPVFEAGQDASKASDPVIVCLIGSQGTGKNLQHHYDTNLVTAFPSSGTAVEQLLGRTHRPGQVSPTVTVEWYAHTPIFEKCFGDAYADSVYNEQTLGQEQRILRAKLL